MFASLKNKIKEETGSDLPTFSTRLSNSGRHSRGRLSSSASIASFDEMQIIEQKDIEINSLNSQCKELTNKVSQLTSEVDSLKEQKDRLEKTNEILLESVKVAQTQKDLITDEQEKIQNIQQDEIARLKSLLSFREQEAVDMISTMKQNQQQIENLKAEIDRLKMIEPMVEDLQDTANQEIFDLKTRLSAADERLSEYVENSEKVTQALRKQNTIFQEQVQELSNALENEKQEKLTALLRNAEISQSEEILKKELRIERDEVNELNEKLHELQDKLKTKNEEIYQLNIKLDELNSVMNSQRDQIAQVDELNNEISEKNKSIKVLNQRLVDIKKTLQQEMKCSQLCDGTAVINVNTTVNNVDKNSHDFRNNGSTEAPIIMDEVNFKYLKHVIVKFLTSREVEARHLIRAVATLLRLNSEEEKLLHDTLNWKMSWFGSKPDHGTGQRAFSIPPS